MYLIINLQLFLYSVFLTSALSWTSTRKAFCFLFLELSPASLCAVSPPELPDIAPDSFDLTTDFKFITIEVCFFCSSSITSFSFESEKKSSQTYKNKSRREIKENYILEGGLEIGSQYYYIECLPILAQNFVKNHCVLKCYVEMSQIQTPSTPVLGRCRLTVFRNKNQWNKLNKSFALVLIV